MLATVLGHALLGAARGRRSVALPESFAFGIVVLSLAFGICSRFGVVNAFGIEACAAAALACVVRPPRFSWRFDVRPIAILGGMLIVGLVVRDVYYVDRIDLDAPHMDVFAWIDTPLWLSVAEGLERSCPPPDLLYAGGVLNYHFGSGLLVEAIRHTTGVPVHVAYFGAMVASFLTTVMLAVRMSRYFFRAPRWLALPIALVATFALERIAFNFPSVVAIPILLWLFLELARVDRVASFVPIVVGLFFVMLTKEVEYVLFVVVGGIGAMLRLVRTRSWRPLAAILIAIALTRPFYERLLRPNQHTRLRLFVERFDRAFLSNELRVQLPWLVVAALALVFLRRRRERDAVLIGVAAYVAGLALSCFVHPDMQPLLDGFSYGWLLIDMFQFMEHGQLVLGATVACVVLVRFVRGPRYSFAAAVPLFVANALSFVKVPPRPPPDPIVPLLARVEPRGAVIAADAFNANDENPHWAAFFGHQFFLLRRGRWATAFPGYHDRVNEQVILFSTSDEKEAASIVGREHITHLVEAKARPVPWLKSTRPILENDWYRVYAF